MCQVDWIMGCPEMCLNLFFAVSVNEGIPRTELTFEIVDLNVGGHPPIH